MIISDSSSTTMRDGIGDCRSIAARGLIVGGTGETKAPIGARRKGGIGGAGVLRGIFEEETEQLVVRGSGGRIRGLDKF